MKSIQFCSLAILLAYLLISNHHIQTVHSLESTTISQSLAENRSSSTEGSAYRNKHRHRNNNFNNFYTSNNQENRHRESREGEFYPSTPIVKFKKIPVSSQYRYDINSHNETQKINNQSSESSAESEKRNNLYIAREENRNSDILNNSNPIRSMRANKVNYEGLEPIEAVKPKQIGLNAPFEPSPLNTPQNKVISTQGEVIIPKDKMYPVIPVQPKSASSQIRTEEPQSNSNTLREFTDSNLQPFPFQKQDLTIPNHQGSLLSDCPCINSLPCPSCESIDVIISLNEYFRPCPCARASCKPCLQSTKLHQLSLLRAYNEKKILRFLYKNTDNMKEAIEGVNKQLDNVVLFEKKALGAAKDLEETKLKALIAKNKMRMNSDTAKLLAKETLSSSDNDLMREYLQVKGNNSAYSHLDLRDNSKNSNFEEIVNKNSFRKENNNLDSLGSQDRKTLRDNEIDLNLYNNNSNRRRNAIWISKGGHSGSSFLNYQGNINDSPGDEDIDEPADFSQIEELELAGKPSEFNLVNPVSNRRQFSNIKLRNRQFPSSNFSDLSLYDSIGNSNSSEEKFTPQEISSINDMMDRKGSEQMSYSMNYENGKNNGYNNFDLDRELENMDKEERARRPSREERTGNYKSKKVNSTEQEETTAVQENTEEEDNEDDENSFNEVKERRNKKKKPKVLGKKSKNRNKLKNKDETEQEKDEEETLVD